jgi:hypothetical protein
MTSMRARPEVASVALPAERYFLSGLLSDPHQICPDCYRGTSRHNQAAAASTAP